MRRNSAVREHQRIFAICMSSPPARYEASLDIPPTGSAAAVSPRRPSIPVPTAVVVAQLGRSGPSIDATQAPRHARTHGTHARTQQTHFYEQINKVQLHQQNEMQELNAEQLHHYSVAQ
jgi:hypothetical protein